MADPIRNRLLEMYRTETGEDLALRMDAVSLPGHTVLYGEGTRPRYVHFMTSGVASIVAALDGHGVVETGMAGAESFPECSFLLGTQTADKRGVIQVPGTALRMWFKDFEEEFRGNAVLRRLVLRAIQYESFTLSQLVVCNSSHHASERLARWLLMVQDRTQEADLPLTQDFLGQMLGSRRSTVTLAAGRLQRAGIIEYRRGNIRIDDRKRLEAAACSCYAVIQKLFVNIF